MFKESSFENIESTGLEMGEKKVNAQEEQCQNTFFKNSAFD